MGNQSSKTNLAQHTFQDTTGFSYRVITEFLLEKKGVKTSIQNVSVFVRSQEKQKPLPESKQPEMTKSKPQDNESHKPQLKKGIKKFDWKNATTEGLI